MLVGYMPEFIEGIKFITAMARYTASETVNHRSMWIQSPRLKKTDAEFALSMRLIVVIDFYDGCSWGEE